MNTLSRRALKLLTEKKHLRPNISRALLVELDPSDKILTVTYSDNQDNVASLFYESLNLLLKNRPFHAIMSLSSREIESFLRDENHLPTFLEGEMAHILQRFGELKASFLATIIHQKLELDSFPIWSEPDEKLQDLVGKNRYFVQLLEKMGLYFKDFPPWRLVYYQAYTLTLTGGAGVFTPKELEIFFQTLLQKEEVFFPIKVVAV